MPSSTEAIMAARRRISSSVPAFMRVEQLARGRVAQLDALLPGRLLLHHLGRRHHIGPARKMLAPVEIVMARRRQVAAVLEVDRAVGRLVGIGMHRLVGEEQRERLAALLRRNRRRARSGGR